MPWKNRLVSRKIWPSVIEMTLVGNVGRHVVGLGLDDRQCRQRAVAIVVVELGRALEQARMQIEHVARIGFAPRRPAQQQRHLPVSDRLLGQIVIADQRMHAVVAEIFAHRAAGERRKELHRRRIGGGRGDDDRIVERAALLEHACTNWATVERFWPTAT